MSPRTPHLDNKSVSAKAKTEIIYGIHPVTEAIGAGKREIYEVYVSRRDLPKRTQERLKKLEARQIPVTALNPAQIKTLSGTETHQGIAARVGRLPFNTLSPLLKRPRHAAEAPPMFLLLDGILDPRNFGALVRTAHCVGIDGIVIPKNRCAQPSPAVSKASAGALEHARLIVVTNLVRTIGELKQAGIWVFGLDGDAATSIFDIDLTGPTAIVVGGEARGVGRLVSVHCDQMAAIPQVRTGTVNSLNASVAGAVAMYEAFRQRCR